MPRLLVTNNHLASYGGSEMVTLELTEEFIARGWDVTVFANYLEGEFRREFDTIAQPGLRLTDDPEEFVGQEFDLIWVHHLALPTPVIQSLQNANSTAPVVFNHMSTIPGIESPVLADIESEISLRSYFNSEETKNALLCYGLDPENAAVLPNPAPRSFTVQTPAPETRKLQTVLLVSNHPPHEVDEAVSALRLRGITIKRVGQDRPERVTPATFEGVDAVISIGKTVQYALCLGIPAYVYDHFGGPGWLNSENFQTVADHNFSGRPERRQLEPGQLIDELLSGYEAAAEYAGHSRSVNLKRYSLELHIDQLLKLADRFPRATAISESHALRWIAYAQTQRDTTRAIQSAWKHGKTLQEIKDQLQTDSDLAHAEATRLRDSFSFRLGHALLAPLRWCTRKKVRVG